ncbi:MAG: bifunctional homocysteine S-methyltransferase/methylenetetrahydrofolate reductase [Mogibacterium sp.]|nr:bifunctional homocysteine S-methyltransferase/methylenetetrahydrofolate reductase [Mogibacterium sp.]
MSQREEIRSKIREQGCLLFDGGMGTYYSARLRTPGSGCERANIDKPMLVSAIHNEYLQAGCEAIKTNTFAANRIVYPGSDDYVKQLLRAGYHVAHRTAAPYHAFVFADIGPVTGLSDEETFEEYRFLVDTFLESGAVNFLFETNASPAGLREIAAYIREKQPDAYIIVSFALLPEGYTRDGLFGEDLVRTIWEGGCVDAVGFNCVIGVRQMKYLLDSMNLGGIPLSIMPNAGYPVVIDNRTFYDSDPAYFGAGLAEIAREGAAIIGGCCGTTPRHIEETRRALPEAAGDGSKPVRRQEAVIEVSPSRFSEKLSRGEKVIAIEMDPPKDPDLSWFMEGAAAFKYAGADIMTIADCPIARARMDSSMLACKVRRELGLDVLPHMTCRDRNLNATKALLLGLSAENVRDVLIVTGDPIPTAERDEVKSVYQFNSRKMASFISGLGKKGLIAPFSIFGALNVNAGNFDVQLRLAKEKEAAGMIGFLTQPVLSDQAEENLRRAREELRSYLLGGLMPVVSERNALFMNSEVNGITVDQSIIDRYRGLDRGPAEDLAVKLTVERAERIAPLVDGFYVITPFRRVELMLRILRELRRLIGEESTR